MYDLLVEDATIVSSSGRRVADIAVEGGVIVYIGDRPGGSARKKTSAIGKFALPGLIDTHVHFRDPGHPHKEDWASGSLAAVSGGVTTVLDMPNTSPPTIDRATFAEKRARAAASSCVDFGLWVGAARGNGAEIRALMESGEACGIKAFMGASTGPLLVDDETLEALFRETRGILGVHAESETVLDPIRERYAATPTPDHNAVRPPAAAVAAVRRLVELTRAWPRPVHVCHVSTAAELEVLEAVRGDLPITTEACPHHLTLSTDDQLGNWMKCNPPIRAETDRRALWTALRRGKIDTIGSDHAPHTREEKERPYWEAPSGIPGVETTFPLLAAAVHQGRLTVERLVQVCAETPARLFRLEKKGALRVGFDADILLYSESENVRLEASDLLTRVGWSPFVGRFVASKPEQVYVRGTLVAQRGQIVDSVFRGRALQFPPS